MMMANSTGDSGSGGSSDSGDDAGGGSSGIYAWFDLNLTSPSTVWNLAADNESDTPPLNASAAPTDLQVMVGVVNGDSHYCDDWQSAQHTLFQTANLCYAVAFLVPRTFTLSVLVTRFVLCCGYVLGSVWAGVYLCAPDILAWHVAFVAINLCHVTYLAYKHFPPRVHPELRELYAKLFQPLQMDKKDFKTLVRDAKLLTLSEGSTYAVEGVTRADQRLSILLRGRLKVSCANNHLHFINAHHFIDSPEWEAGTEHLFQVTVTAVEDACYVCWSRPRLQQVLKCHPFLEAAIYNLIGKDITYKLYSLNENINPVNPSRRGGNNEWTTNNWQGVPVTRSLSVDAVHTGSRGQVKSQMWPAHLRRDSSTGSESLGYSPARISRFSHLSDPGPTHASPARSKVYGEPDMALTVCPVAHQVQLPNPVHDAFETLV